MQRRLVIAGYLAELRRYNRNTRLYMWATGIFSFTLSNGIFPVLFNLYLLRLGYGPQFVGTVNSAGSLGLALFALPASVAARRWGLRRPMVAGFILCAVSYGLIPLAYLLPGNAQSAGIILARLLASLGMSLYLVNSIPFLVGAASLDLRASVCAFQVVTSQLLGLLGNLTGGALPGILANIMGSSEASPVPYRITLLGAAVLGLASGWVMAFAKEPNVGKAPVVKTDVKARSGAPWAVIIMLALAAMLQTTAVGVCKTFFNVYLDDYLRVSTANIGVIFAIVALISAGAAMAMPKMNKRWGPHALLFSSSLLTALGLLPLAFVPTWGAALLGRITVSSFASINAPALNVLQTELVTPQWRSTMNGAINMTKQISWVAIAFAGGFIVTASGYRALFLLAMGLSLVGTALYGAYFRSSSLIPEEEALGEARATEGGEL